MRITESQLRSIVRDEILKEYSFIEALYMSPQGVIPTLMQMASEMFAPSTEERLHDSGDDRRARGHAAHRVAHVAQALGRARSREPRTHQSDGPARGPGIRRGLCRGAGGRRVAQRPRGRRGRLSETLRGLPPSGGISRHGWRALRHDDTQ